MHPGEPPHRVRSTADVELTSRLREDLASSDFTVDGVEDLLGPLASAALHREQAFPRSASSGTRSVGALDIHGAFSPDARTVLTAVFLLGLEVRRADLDRALPGTGTAGAARLGLVEAAGEGPDDAVRARVDLRPYAAEDAVGPVSTGGWPPTSASWPPAAASLPTTCSAWAGHRSRSRRSRCAGRSAGCSTSDGLRDPGAARRPARGVGWSATDISPRALRVRRSSTPRSTARASTSARGRCSSPSPARVRPRGLQPAVRHHAPPPRACPRYEYRDGGRAGDELVRELVRASAAVLAPGGVAQLLGNWEVRRGEPWHERVGQLARRSPGSTAGSSSGRCWTPPSTPRPGSATAGRRPSASARRGRRRTRRGSTTSRRATSRRSGFGIVTLRRPCRGR